VHHRQARGVHRLHEPARHAGLPAREHAHRLTLAWQRGRWGASATGRHFSPIVEDCRNVVNIADAVGAPIPVFPLFGPGHLQDGRQAPRNRVGAVTHVDLETSWRAPWTGVFTPGARNALDRDPPLARSYSTFASFSPITTSPAASTTQPPAEVLNWSHRSNGNST
jgi:hypothetical protein